MRNFQVFARNADGTIEPVANVEADATLVEESALVFHRHLVDSERRWSIETVAIFASGEWTYAVEAPDAPPSE